MTMHEILLALSLASMFYLAYKASTTPSHKSGSPHTVPHLIPWLGNAFEFSLDTLAFLAKRRYDPVYRIVVAGKSIVVLSDLNTINFLNRDPAKAFSNEEILTRIITQGFGVTSNPALAYEVTEQKLFPVVAKWFFQSGTAEEFMRRMDKEFVTQLKALGNPTRPRVVKLDDLVARSLYFAACLAFFGPSFPAQETLADFQLIDAKAPQLIAGIPLMASDAIRARERMLSKVVDFIAPWWDSNGSEEIDGAPEMAVELLLGIKGAQLSKGEAATLLMLFLWGSQTNTWYMVYWMIANLAVDQSTMECIRQEVDAFTASEKEGLREDASSTPLIESVITEALRWATTTAVFRKATKDTRIPVDNSAIVVHEGEYLLADVKAFHYDPTIFDEPEIFKAERYIKDSTPVPPLPVAWGGGTHLCKGKAIALLEMRQIIVRLFQLYTVRTVSRGGDKGQIPKLRNPTSSFGSLGASNDEFCVELFPRQTVQEWSK